MTTPQIAVKWMTVCLSCSHVMDSKQYACSKCDSDNVRQHDIGYLFPGNIERFVSADEIKDICEPDWREKEAPELARIRENEKPAPG